MNRSELIDALVAAGAGDKRHVSNMLKHQEQVIADALGRGEDVVIPGIVKLTWDYRARQAKGSRWKKGDMRTKFGGEQEVAEEDSPAVTERFRLKAAVTGAAYRLRPGTKPEAQKEFKASKTGKAVLKRKKA